MFVLELISSGPPRLASSRLDSLSLCLCLCAADLRNFFPGPPSRHIMAHVSWCARLDYTASEHEAVSLHTPSHGSTALTLTERTFCKRTGCMLRFYILSNLHNYTGQSHFEMHRNLLNDEISRQYKASHCIGDLDLLWELFSAIDSCRQFSSAAARAATSAAAAAAQVFASRSNVERWRRCVASSSKLLLNQKYSASFLATRSARFVFGCKNCLDLSACEPGSESVSPVQGRALFYFFQA